MNLLSLQAQRQLEVFLRQAGIRHIEPAPSLHFAFSDHELFIDYRHRSLWMTVTIAAELDDDQLLTLFIRVFPGLTTQYLIRPFRTMEGAALNTSLSDDVTSEQLVLIYRTMLRQLSPWRKRTHS
ncbi:MAG TPA: hypothetical protein VGL07_13415 [Buttiauxella sp.]|jgi:hypothetical protein